MCQTPLRRCSLSKRLVRKRGHRTRSLLGVVLLMVDRVFYCHSFLLLSRKIGRYENQALAAAPRLVRREKVSQNLLCVELSEQQRGVPQKKRLTCPETSFLPEKQKKCSLVGFVWRLHNCASEISFVVSFFCFFFTLFTFGVVFLFHTMRVKKAGGGPPKGKKQFYETLEEDIKNNIVAEVFCPFLPLSLFLSLSFDSTSTAPWKSLSRPSGSSLSS